MITAVASADNVFIFSNATEIRGVNLTLQEEYLLTASPFANGVNALAVDTTQGLVYYGSGTTAYMWDPALGASPVAHTVLNDFSTAPLQLPINNMDSTSGSFYDGKWFVGSESNVGFIEDIFELTMTTDGKNILSGRPLNLLAACGCTGADIGGFGDIAATFFNGNLTLFGSSADLTGGVQGGSAGRWRFTPATNNFEFLQTGTGGQLSNGLDGTLYTNVGSSIRTMDANTGAVGTTNLFTVASAIFDFTSGINFDFGDAPASYGSAFHELAATPLAYLGPNPADNEPGMLDTASGGSDGTGDDDIGIDDEDGVGALAPLDVTAGSYGFNVDCAGSYRVVGWIDLNLNSQFDPGERNSNHPVNCAAGTASLQWANVSSAAAGQSYVRLRTSTVSGDIASPTGIAPDGEIEDHSLTILGLPSSGSCPGGSVSNIFNATDLPRNIGPNQNTTTVSTVNVPNSLIITDVNVLGVQGTHTYINDLIFDLRFSGTTQRLYGPSCGSQNNFSFSFDDEGAGTPPCPPTNGGTFPPVQALSAFDGQDAVGNWQLRIRDRFNGDAGVLQNWSLEICSAGGNPEMPDLRVGKTASVSDREVTFTLTAQNTGNTDLTGITLIDDLDTVMGVGNFTIIQPPTFITAPAGFVANASYTGSGAQTDLVQTSGTMTPLETLTVQFVIQVDTIAGSPLGEYANSATMSGTSPSGTVISDISGSGLDISSDSDDPTLFALNASISLSGNVFTDTSAIPATAHNGLIDADEPGVPSRVVTITDVATSTVVGTTNTDAAGGWAIGLPASLDSQQVSVSVTPDTGTRFISEAPAYATGPVTDGEVLVTPSVNNPLSDIDIGVVNVPTLAADQSGVATAGGSVQYPHVYTAPSHGTLSVSVTGTATPATPVWPLDVVLDANCNSQIDSGETAIPSLVNVAQAETVCVIVVVNVPVDVASGTPHVAELTTDLVLDDASGTGHSVSFQLANFDNTTASAVGQGVLQLAKSVRNITTGDVVSTSNTALPGHTLEYVIEYSNSGVGQLNDLVVNDVSPPFTTIVTGTASCDTPPAGMTCSASPTATTIEWTFTGPLVSGASGSVSYRVLVD